MKTSLQIITTCKGRLDHLERTLPTWLAHTPFDVIVVDFDCPDRCADWAEALSPRVHVVRVPDRPVFNASEARNAGLRVAESQWVCFIDADVLLTPCFAAAASTLDRDSHFYLVDQAEGDLYGTMVAPLDVVRGLGGFDEAILGWGCEDMDMRRRLEGRGLRAAHLPRACFDFIPHGDDRRSIVHTLKGRGLLINQLYIDAKQASMGALRRELSLVERRALYGQVANMAHRLSGTALPELHLATPWDGWCPGIEARIRLDFEFRPARV